MFWCWFYVTQYGGLYGFLSIPKRCSSNVYSWKPCRGIHGEFLLRTRSPSDCPANAPYVLLIIPYVRGNGAEHYPTCLVSIYLLSTAWNFLHCPAEHAPRYPRCNILLSRTHPIRHEPKRVHGPVSVRTSDAIERRAKFYTGFTAFL